MDPASPNTTLVLANTVDSVGEGLESQQCSTSNPSFSIRALYYTVLSCTLNARWKAGSTHTISISQNPNNNPLTNNFLSVYMTDGVDCSLDPTSGSFRRYEPTISDSAAASISLNNVCQTDPCCVVILCNNLAQPFVA